MGPALAAGIVGALLGGGAVLALAVPGFIPGLSRPVDRGAEIRAIADRVGALEALRSRVETVERAGQGARPDLGPLRAEIEQIRAAVASLGQPGTPAAPSAPDPQLADAVARLGEAVTALDGRIAAIDQRVGTLDPAPLQRDLQALAARVNELGQSIATTQRAERAAALTLSLNALRNAVARGGPFETELQAVRALGVESPAIAGLAARASAGVPSAARLLDRLRGSARAMMAAAEPPPDGTLDRLGQAAARLVSIRPVGETPGPGAGAAVARMEARLQRGDIAGAKAEFDTLPPAAQSAGAAFLTDLQARLEADGFLQAITDDIAKLAPPRG